MDVNRSIKAFSPDNNQGGHGALSTQNVQGFQSSLQMNNQTAGHDHQHQHAAPAPGSNLANLSNDDKQALAEALTEVLALLIDLLGDGSGSGSSGGGGSGGSGAGSSGGNGGAGAGDVAQIAPQPVGSLGAQSKPGSMFSVSVPQLSGKPATSLEDGQVQHVNAPQLSIRGQEIPKPTQHVSTFQLGNKQVRIGGDGSASQAEVLASKQGLENMYQTSPTFKNMIDSSSDQAYEVSIGKRSDNTSWGNADGRVFLNLNNIAPGNNDVFQFIAGHEFGHAAADLEHGDHLKQLESQIANEAA